LNDAFFVDAVRPYCWFAAVMLFISYMIGLLFTLRTHAAVIWTTDGDEKKPLPVPTAEVSPSDSRHHSTGAALHTLSAPSPSYAPTNSVRDSALYKRILGQSLKQFGVNAPDADRSWDQISSHRSPALRQSEEVDQNKADATETPHVVPPRNKTGENGFANIPGMPTLSEEENHHLATYVAEVAATAATVAARDATKAPRRASFQAQHSYQAGKTSRPQSIRQGTAIEVHPPTPGGEPAGHGAGEGGGGGHDAPNWSRTKSSIVLCAATVAYALIAEVLVNTVDVVLQSVDIDEKFLGITLFALVPNTTEFLNAISFAMNGNIALSMEIGSAYALQVCLLQIPALVLFSAVRGRWIDAGNLIDHTFSLIFPQFDMVTVILCVFLLSYMYGEGKSNYFKGGILILTYLVVIMGFYYSGYTRFDFDVMGVDPTDTLAIMAGYGRGQRPASHGEL
jgi:Ca2+:H+ antiporter